VSLIAEDLREWFHLRRWLRTEDSGRREVFGPVEQHPCRWEPGARRVQTVDGRTVIAQGTLWTSARLTAQEVKKLQLWLPGDNPDDVGQSRLPMQVFVHTDLETGAFDHSEVVL
jgi:hypothetical protein